MRGEDQSGAGRAVGKSGNTPTCVGKTQLFGQYRWNDRKHPHVRGEDPLCAALHQHDHGNTPTCVGKTLQDRASGLGKGKHPHVRGEDKRKQERSRRTLETPPRAWGRPEAALAASWLSGNTPTCVGKTAQRPFRHARRQKHPHVRGEDSRADALSGRAWETPPRAWGRLLPGPAHLHRCRNTPTCVGKTRQHCRRMVAWRKHPHVRGEDAPSLASMLGNAETPPRAWGRPFEAFFGPRASGNTPTCVGKTHPGQQCQALVRKHPHVRGEDPCTTAHSDTEAETPPRAWGRLARRRMTVLRPRNTPTCVGKTPCWAMPTLYRSKHPHVRGEDPASAYSWACSPETPPRAWGRRSCWPGLFQLLRNTPTCVGKTLRGAGCGTRPRKHPHVRGEDPGLRCWRQAALETPPRAWGRR